MEGGSSYSIGKQGRLVSNARIDITTIDKIALGPFGTGNEQSLYLISASARDSA
jgi:hypothetical protein